MMNNTLTTSKFVCELRNRIRMFYGNLETLIIYDDEDTTTIRVRLYSDTSIIATYMIQNGSYQGMYRNENMHLYKKEINACKADIISACREIISL